MNGKRQALDALSRKGALGGAVQLVLGDLRRPPDGVRQQIGDVGVRGDQPATVRYRIQPALSDGEQPAGPEGRLA